MPLGDYIEYVLYNRDDEPMYMWEMEPEQHPEANVLLDDYTPPKYFPNDYFKDLLGEDFSPPHRWWLFGPQRSGSNVHQDPLGTSAWNTSLMGHKRWVMMPARKGLTKEIVRGHKYLPGLKIKPDDMTALEYF
eukprot:CAMPEP_0176348912 /NCGR_PEP_ID=MMETSP0126-20121128/8254_1 /TAXON_ID=141414 ORGANISM="Strombidinopsis acuminatum, Strain SPMC142" /NCGR_SAMPLE_ID=MMETSP0126 /ASSEMBLY_ACC=CAM_ASM_000229 /LENGTH=132 /DNA_ID=CAMNT_0017698007 /DNA_START=444 /DNA_END=842 /DNA_ORIENTATION=-